MNYLMTQRQKIMSFSCVNDTLTFSRFIDLRVASMPFTTPAIDFVTCEKKHHH